MEEYLSAGVLSDGTLSGLIGGRKLFPCLFGAALRLEGVEELLERLNCDDVLEMRAMALEPLEPLESLNVDAFRQVLKQCRSEPQPVVAFFSHVPPSAELVQFFAGLAPLQRIEVVQEGAVLRRSFSLVFTREEETCDNRFVLCNLRGVAPNAFCHVQSGYAVERVSVVWRVWNEQRHNQRKSIVHRERSVQGFHTLD